MNWSPLPSCRCNSLFLIKICIQVSTQFSCGSTRHLFGSTYIFKYSILCCCFTGLIAPSLLISTSGTIAEGIAVSKKHISRRRIESAAPKDTRAFSCTASIGDRHANAIEKTNFIALLSSHSWKRSVIGWGNRLRGRRCRIKSIFWRPRFRMLVSWMFLNIFLDYPIPAKHTETDPLQ